MVRAHRKLTGAVLLASYVAATIGAWSHGRHDCREAVCADHVSAAHVCHDHTLSADFDRPLANACGDSSHGSGESTAMLGAQPDAHSHHFDQCLLCQFLAIQKVIESSDEATTAGAVVARRLPAPDQELLLADSVGTPDSRGPPQA